MGSVERKERERQEMRQLILETAMELFVEQGYENVTIRKIADKIEYSPGTIYFYFKDKDDVLLALCSVAFGEFFKALKPMRDVRDPMERLRAGSRMYLRFALEHQEFYDLMFIIRAPMRRQEELRKEADEHQEKWDVFYGSFQILRDTICDCVAEGYFPPATDIDAATIAYWSFVHGLASLRIRQRLPMIPEEGLEQVVNRAIDFMVSELSIR
ncbi:MAG: TetR/AcrR family transcriptional regulator [Chlorobi bacterium]|nr:TetR/AcrR family transcriptional regulator [Chlorobiota bacterium]